VATTVYRGSDAEALLNGFHQRRRTGSYYNDFGGPAAELRHVTFNTIPPHILDISTIPTGQTQSRIIYNRNASALSGSALIQRAVTAIERYNTTCRTADAEPIVITFRPPRTDQRTCTSIAINEEDMQRLVNSNIDSSLFDDDLDPALSSAGRANIVTSELADAVDPAWITPRPTTPEQAATFDRLRSGLHTAIDLLNTTDVRGHYVNPEHIQGVPNVAFVLPGTPVEDVFVHRNRSDGEAMLDLLSAIRDHNEQEFFRHTLILATGFPAERRTSQIQLVEDFSFLFATYYFRTITDQRQNLHIWLRCGHMY
jgi:hypothetical protein